MDIKETIYKAFRDGSAYSIEKSRDDIKKEERKGIYRAYEVKPKPYAGTCRNDMCPCGSGKKYKKCCGR